MYLPNFRLLLLAGLFACLAPLQAQAPALPPTAPAETTPAAPAETTPATPVPTPISPVIPPATPSETTPPQPTAPPALPGQTRPVHIHSQRQLLSLETGEYQFIGDVTLETGGFTLKAAQITYYSQTEKATAEGNVSIRTPDGITYWGNELEINLTTLEWQFAEWSVQYPAQFLGQPFIGPLFVNGKSVTGLPGLVHAQQSRVTTCDLPVPHYFLISDRVDIYPGDKLIAYDSDLYVLGRRVLHVPWFILFLNQRRSPIVPDAGYNDAEGYYLRLLYQYVINPNELGGVRLDLTQKLGPGLGVDHYYTLAQGYGEAFLYGRQGLNEYVARVDHTQQLPGDISTHLTVDTRQDSQFTDQPTTLTNINLQAQRAVGQTHEQLTYTRLLNAGTFASDSDTANLRIDNDTGVNSVHVSEEYSQYATTGESTETQTEDLWSRLQASHKFDFGTLNLRVDQHADLGSTMGTQTSGVQRLPELYLETDQTQLHWNFLDAVPSHFTTGIGEFDEQPTGERLARYLFNWNSTPRPIVLGSTTLSPTGSFRQTIYGDKDNTAMYVLQDGLAARTGIIEKPALTLANVANYSRQDNHGFTPFEFDASYPFETINDSVQLSTPKSQTFLAGGRDIQNKVWQDITLRTAVAYGPVFSMGQSVAYNPNQGQWRALVSQFHWETGPDHPAFYLDLGSRYDLQAGQLQSVSTELSWVINPLWKLQWLGGYDGTRNEILYNEYLITRDLHCWDASLYISQQQKSFYLLLRMKALNLPLPQFGIGRAGQVLSPGQGTVY